MLTRYGHQARLASASGVIRKSLTLTTTSSYSHNNTSKSSQTQSKEKSSDDFPASTSSTRRDKTKVTQTNKIKQTKDKVNKQIEPPKPPRSPKKSTTKKRGTPLRDEIENLKKINVDISNQLKSTIEERDTFKKLYEDLLGKTQKPENPDAVADRSSVDHILHLDSTHSTLNSSIETTVPVKRRLLILGDSMSRDFDSLLKTLLPDYSITSFTYPGAKFSHVVQNLQDHTRSFTKMDTVFILAGTNDVPHLTPCLLDEIFKLKQDVFLRTNVIVSCIPYMHHSRGLKNNTNIFATNQCLLRLSQIHKFYLFDINHKISRIMYTRHGLHFNTAGKKVFCVEISNCVKSKDSCTMSYSLTAAPVLSTANTQINNDELISDITCPIQLHETNFFDSLCDETSLMGGHTQEITTLSSNNNSFRS